MPLEIDKDTRKRSKRVIRLFNAAQGKTIGSFPGPIPPFSKWLNSKIISAARGEILLELDLRPEMANPTGLLHGGVQSAIMDDTIGMLTATLGYKGFLITIDFQINYLGRIKVSETIRTKAKVTREGRKVVNIRCTIKDLEGNVISIGSANLLRTGYTPDYIKTIDGTTNVDDLTKND